jgi:Fic family protein
MNVKNAQAQWIWQQPDWPEVSWRDAELAPLLREINQLQGKLLGSAGTIARSESHQSEMDALLQNAINTSAIEGEQLNVDSVRSSLARRLGMDQAGLPPGTPQTEGLADVLLDATRHPERPLTESRLYQWHQALFPTGEGGVIHIRVGELRGDDPMQVVSGPIGHRTVHFEAPPRQGLEAEMHAFLDWFNRSLESELDPVLRAGLAHLWFVTLHPFDDGNGRLARAITDLALAQAEHHSVRFYAMAATIMENRKAYYEMLEQSQRGGLDVTTWLKWFLTMLRQTLQVADTRIEHVLKKARFWQQHAQSVLSERQVKVLNRLLNAGPEGFKGGLNASKYMGLTSVSKATATRDLTELVEKGCLVQRPGGGRSTSYDINWS